MKTHIKILFVLISVVGFCQNRSWVKEFSDPTILIAPVEWFQSTNVYGQTVGADLIFNLNQNLFSVSGTFIEKQIPYTSDFDINALHAKLGRNFKALDWLDIETQIGIGHEFYPDNNNAIISKTVFPLVTKLKVYSSESLSIVIRLHAVNNSIIDKYSACITLKWNRIKTL